MPESKGLYPKYVVFKHPGYVVAAFEGSAIVDFTDRAGDLAFTGRPLEQVEDFYFVLKPGSDRHARVAMAAYAQSVMEDDPLLGEELMQIINDGPRK